MKQLVCFSFIDVIGDIWQPGMGTCSMRYTPRVEDLRDENGVITRESILNWLRLNAGDFQSIEDFTASIEDGPTTLDFPWAREESEMLHSDCMGD